MHNCFHSAIAQDFHVVTNVNMQSVWKQGSQFRLEFCEIPEILILSMGFEKIFITNIDFLKYFYHKK